MSKYSLLTVIFSLLTVIFSLLTVIFSLFDFWKPYTARLSAPLKKEKKKKRKKEKRFFMKNSPMPSLKLGRFNLAKARLRGCFFFKWWLRTKSRKKQKQLWSRFARIFSKAKALDSKNYRAANIFKSGFSEVGISEFSVCRS